MGRFPESENEDPLAYGRWEWNLSQTLKGKRGQRILRELREALLAMPEHRLMQTRLATPTGAVCSLGALAAYRDSVKSRITFHQAVMKLAEKDPEGFHEGWVMRLDEAGNELWTVGGDEEWLVDDDLAAEEYSLGVGVSLGMSETLAWYIGANNDNLSHTYSGGGYDPELMTPEQRWTEVLKWLDAHIAREKEMAKTYDPQQGLSVESDGWLK